MNISQAISYGKSQLLGLKNPKLETEVILMEILQKSRIFIKINESKNLSFFQKLWFLNSVRKRKKRVPMAYIFGYKYWNDLKILVNRHTLIPRDETEILCHHILEFFTSKKSTPQTILDIGTGSGCLAVWLKKKFPKTVATAIDISPNALKIARKNAKLQKVEMAFIKSDLFQKIPENAYFDLIIANLPYIPKSQENLAPDLFYEPPMAIFSGEDGLDCLRAFAKELDQKKIIYQTLWIEFLPQQKNEIEKIFVQGQITFLEDSGGNVFFACIEKTAEKLR